MGTKKTESSTKKTLVKITGALKCVGVCRYIFKTIIHKPGGILPH